MSDNNSNPDDAPDLVPTCRFNDTCTLLLTPGGCDSCEFTRDDILRDQDGDPVPIPNAPADITG